MSGRNQRIDDMLAREAIRELPVRYCHYVRTRNLEGLFSLFADDAVFDIGGNDGGNVVPNGTRTGKKAIEDPFHEGLGKFDPWPFVHNHVIDLKGPDRAMGWVYAEFREGNANMRTTMIVAYQDEYARENGRWQFKRRKLNVTPIPA